ncbi:hypothetical protein BO94DRAFT_545622 [Aspergillus sclerotioniger CBS 115572]|uniref:Uncharacterized protein n=1 Tax=Aspergillus sclerotioniger CBS 115572 TaxID=1450535 RepID=A0A317WV08_9EURO|nr:hypothetical protein BO94DRAFT_545622 [Aspergillus sclerotioniger CBS 115572]PWY89651.1 hypothetical protein BO94DRAFT_545622 [Aspergillus sclerotioniger CBS 115572]
MEAHNLCCTPSIKMEDFNHKRPRANTTSINLETPKQKRARASSPAEQSKPPKMESPEPSSPYQQTEVLQPLDPMDIDIDDDRMYPYKRKDLLKRSDYVATIRGVGRLLTSDGEGWSTTHKYVGRLYRVMEQRMRPWILDFVLHSLQHLSNEQMRIIIQSLEGYCVQEEWTALKRRLPDAARNFIGELFAESLIYKTIMTRVFEN